MIEIIKKYKISAGLFVLPFLYGCSVTPVQFPEPTDPWESTNRSIMEFNDDFDESAFKPIARTYQKITPDIVDVGISNFFGNLYEVSTTVNGALQGKPKQSIMDASRFIVNSSIGILGIFDVAKHIYLPKHDEDFGQTLAVWGVPKGNYVVLPFYGPSSVRAIVGRVGDMALHPFTYTPLFANVAVGWTATGLRVVEAIDMRADFLGAEAVASEAALDKYTFFRSAYNQQREYLIKDGEVEILLLDEDEDDEE